MHIPITETAATPVVDARVDQRRVIVDTARDIPSSSTPQADFDHLRDLWGDFVPRFDSANTWFTVEVLNAVGSLVDANVEGSEASLVASIDGCKEFLDAFRAQRRDLLSDNCDYLLALYHNLSDSAPDTEIKREIDRVFHEAVVQTPRGESTGRLMDFFTERDKLNVKKEPLRGGSTNLTMDALITAEHTFEATPITSTVERETAITAIMSIAEASLSEYSLVQQEAKTFISKQIESLGLDEQTLFKAWERTTIKSGTKPHIELPGERRKFVARNIATMFRLESAAPGICKTLHEEFGICDFERYPAEALLAQYENRDKDMPYGIAIYAQDDNNGAFASTNGQPTEKLYRDLRDLDYGLRIYEVRTTSDVLKTLIKTHRRYGEQNQISFVLIGAHGREDSIHFEEEGGLAEGRGAIAFKQEDLERVFRKEEGFRLWPRKQLTKDHANWRTQQKLRSMFIDNPTVILDSCSTGAKGGIGDKFVEIGARAFGPKKPGKLISIMVTKDRLGKLVFMRAEYSYVLDDDSDGRETVIVPANTHARRPFLRRF